MAARSIFRRVYDGAAMFSLLNMAILVALTFFAFLTGFADRKKLAQVAAVWRGEMAVPSPAAAGGEATQPPMEATATTVAPDAADTELLRREAERIKAELDQQTALVQSMMVKIAGEREAVRKERESLKKPEDTSMAQRREEGLRKQIEIYEQLAPKVALEHLLGLEDVDQAAQVIAEMEPRKAKRIIEAAKTSEQSTRIQAILRRVQDVAPSRSAELAAAGS